jgi:hypothetical protein
VTDVLELEEEIMSLLGAGHSSGAS